MLEISRIIENKGRVLAGLEKRNIKNLNDIDTLVELVQAEKKFISKSQDLRTEQNTLSKKIAETFKRKKQDNVEDLKMKVKSLKADGINIDKELKVCRQKMYEILITIPNIPDESVPFGTSYKDNEIVADFNLEKIKPTTQVHWDLLEQFKLADFKSGVKISGSGFPFLVGKGSILQRGLINFFLDEAVKADYLEYSCPLLVNGNSGFGTGQLPDKEGQMYHIKEDNLYLIPTSEVPLTNIFRDEIIDKKKLPIKSCAYTPCFRREAGSYGKDVRGLNRLHQFDKVEIVQIVQKENSYKTFEEMVEHVKKLLLKLEMPFRILKLCGADMGFTSALTYDFEVFSNAQKRWLEVSSVSNFETFQSNRMKIRYKNAKAKSELLHTLNGSALALPRIVASLLENNYQDGKILMPEVLHDYLGFSKIKL